MSRGVNDRILVWVGQVPGTSRSGSASVQRRGGGSGGNCATTAVQTPQPQVERTVPTARESREGAEGAPPVIALREGAALPDGYIIVARDPAPPPPAVNHTETDPLCTPPAGGPNTGGEDLEAAKRASAAKRNATRSTNKQVLATFAKEMKESLAGGRPPSIDVSADQTHLKARWHSAAKEAAYKFLDLRKDSWKCYTFFEKENIHRELNEHYKFDPMLDPKRVDKYLASHLRSSRAVWKAHWLKNGDDNRHPNCPDYVWVH